MRKYILISGIATSGFIVLILIYLSIYGIKTNKFNNLINEKIKVIDQKISLQMQDVYLKLNLTKKNIKINTKDTKVYADNEFIELSNIDINLDLIKFIRNDNSIKTIKIISKENSIKKVTNFINTYKFSIPRLLIFKQIEKGSIKATANIYFNEENQKDFNYEINGKIKDAKINLPEKNYANDINFNFNIKDQLFIFENVDLKYENINLQSNKIEIFKSGKNFEIKGDLKSKKGLIEPNSFSKIANISLDFLEEKEILIETKNEFSFKFNSNDLIKDLNLNSILKFDEIFINKKYQDLVYLKDGIIETKFYNKDLSVNILSKYSFIEDDQKKTVNDNNDLHLHIVKKNNENIKVTGILKSNKRAIDPNVLLKLAKIKFDLLPEKKIKLETENKFNFIIDEKQKIKDLSINSNIKFDKLYFNKIYQDLIFLEDGAIKADLYKKNFEIFIDSKYSFLNKKYNNNKENNNIILNVKKENDKNIRVESFIQNQKTKINSKEFTKYFKIDQKFFKDQEIIFGSDSKIRFEIDKNKKIKNLKIKSNLNFDNIKIKYASNRLKKRFPNYKNEIHLNSNQLELEYSKNKTLIESKGRYSIDEKNFDNFEIKLNDTKEKLDFETYLEANNNLFVIEEIDYKKKKNVNLKVKVKGNYNKNDGFEFKDILFLDDKNKIVISNLNLSQNYRVTDIDLIELKFINKNKKFNDLKIYKNNNIYELKGKYFDGKSLVENKLKGNSNNSFLKIFENLNSEIKLNLDKFYTGNQSYLENIDGKIIVKNNKIQAGSINAILNKKNKFSLNIKTNSKNEKNTILYIERPEPFIRNYKFIKGFKEGALSYESIEKNGLSKSSLRIYDFKVQEVPVLAKILTLASLQGIADLLTGEGIRFDEFEMDYESENKLTTVNEIYAIGPAISLMMEGYIEKDKLTSLRGTLVPATTINKTIAKIPLVGNILVGKKIGEGVFGVSFKIKGPPKNLKTTVNPIKTLTPRFITRTLGKLMLMQ